MENITRSSGGLPGTGEKLISSGRSLDLEEELTIVQFSKIMDRFELVGQQDLPYQRSPQMTTDDFKSIVAEVFGKKPEDRRVKALCNKVSRKMAINGHQCNWLEI